MTPYKVGKTYPMEGGEFGTVTEMHEDHMKVRHLQGMEYQHRPDGRLWNSDSSTWDLLPAIEPAEGFSGPTVDALKAVRDAWEDFREGVFLKRLDSGRGGVCICGQMGLSIRCDYPGADKAQDDAEAVIAGLDALIGGQIQ